MFIRTTIAALLLVITVVIATTGTASASANAETNHAKYWGENCTKTEMRGEVISYDAPAGATKVIVKGGTGYKVYDKAPFTNLTSPVNPKNGKPYAISHVIVCNDKIATTASATKTEDTQENLGTPAELPNAGAAENALMGAGALAVIFGYVAHRRVTPRQSV